MAKVVKLINNVRTTELDALSDAMEREYRLACGDGATAVAKDAVLKAQFAQLADLSARNTTAIRQDAVVSTLDEADSARDSATRDLFTLAGGYTASPFAEVRAAAVGVCAVLDKYGRGMTGSLPRMTATSRRRRARASRQAHSKNRSSHSSTTISCRT